MQFTHHESTRRPRVKRRATGRQRRHQDRAAGKQELRQLIHETRR